MGGSNLGLNDWDSHGEETDTKTLDSSSSNEASQVRSESLEESHREVYESTNTHTSLSSHDISKIASSQRSNGGRKLQAGHSDTCSLLVSCVAYGVV